jgi:hypothetical protein
MTEARGARGPPITTNADAAQPMTEWIGAEYMLNRESKFTPHEHSFTCVHFFDSSVLLMRIESQNTILASLVNPNTTRSIVVPLLTTDNDSIGLDFYLLRVKKGTDG